MTDILYIFSGSPLLYALVLVLIAIVASLIWKSFKTKYKFIILGVLGLGIIAVFLFSFINNQQESFEPNPPGKSGYALTLKEVWGVKSWVTTVERPGTDYPREVLQTSDGGFILAGSTASIDASRSPYTYLLKVDKDGNKMWENYASEGSLRSVQQTSDGGYIIAAEIQYTSNPWQPDILLIKTDRNGNVRDYRG